MSDLAPFVAAVIRDKVVSDLQTEIEQLRNELYVERYKSKTVAITGPNGTPVYACAQFDLHGNFDNSPELWKVEFVRNNNTDDDDGDEHFDDDNNSNNHHDNFDVDDDAASLVTVRRRGDGNSTRTSTTTETTRRRMRSTNQPSNPNSSTTNNRSVCTLNNLYDMEVRIGGICKARFATSLNGNGVAAEGFVNDIYNNYCPIQKSGKVSIWFASGIWLTINIGPSIERDRYASLRDYDLSGPNLLNTLLEFWNNNPNTIVEFLEVSFMICHVNEAMERWNLLGPRGTRATRGRQRGGGGEEASPPTMSPSATSNALNNGSTTTPTGTTNASNSNTTDDGFLQEGRHHQFLLQSDDDDDSSSDDEYEHDYDEFNEIVI